MAQAGQNKTPRYARVERGVGTLVLRGDWERDSLLFLIIINNDKADSEKIKTPNSVIYRVYFSLWPLHCHDLVYILPFERI